MPDNDISLADDLSAYPQVPLPVPAQSWNIVQQPTFKSHSQVVLEKAAQQQKEDPNYDPEAIVRMVDPQPAQTDPDIFRKSAGFITYTPETEEEQERKRIQKERAEALANREVIRRPVRLSPEAYEHLSGLVSSGVMSPERAEYIIAGMDDGQRMNTLALAAGNIKKTLDMVRAAGMPDAQEVERIARETSLPFDVVRQLALHARDELEAQALTIRLLEIYGSEEALRKSRVMDQASRPAEMSRNFYDIQEQARFEAALMEGYGGTFAAMTGESAFGRFVDQNLHRAKRGYLEIGRGTLTEAHGWVSTIAEMVGADRVHQWANNWNNKIQRHDPYPALNTGNPRLDWAQDMLLIDVPNLGSQFIDFFVWGPALGGSVRTMRMMGSSLSTLEQQGVPLHARVPLAASNAIIQRTIEERYLYPRYATLTAAIKKIPAAGRPFGNFVIEGGKNVIKQMPDELLQESVGKITHDIGYLFTEGATAEGFLDRLSSGWEGPGEGAVTAGAASAVLMALGGPRALQSHFRYRSKIAAVQKTLDAARSSAQRQANPEAFRESMRPIAENALRYNQDAPAEVYITAERFDQLIADEAERRKILNFMGASEEYSRSRATGASMAIRIEGYTAAIAGHAKEADFQKYIQVDLDGPSALDEEKSAAVFENLRADANALLEQMRDLTSQTELPPELRLLRDDLRALDQLTADEADQLAALRYASVKMAAAELGVTPGEYIRTHNVRVKFSDLAATQEQLDGIISESEAFFSALDGAGDPTGAAEPGPETASAETRRPAAAAEAGDARPAAEAPAHGDAGFPSVYSPVQDAARPPRQYEPTAAEKAYGEKRAAAIEAMRLELGSLLMQGKSLTGKALERYGLTGWHPQSVRMRMEDMKRESAAWRLLQDPALVAQAQNETGSPQPSARIWNQSAGENLDSVIQASQKIDGLFDAILDNPAESRRYVDLRPVGEAEAARIEQETGIDVSGFTHAIDGSGILHAMKEHGPGQEKLADQLPVTKDDFLAIPLVLEAPDNIELSGRTPSGLELIRYRKNIGDTLYVVEEVRTGRKKLALKTLYKKKEKPGVAQTSETFLPQEQAPRATDSSEDGKRSDLVTHDVSMTGNDPDNTPLRAAPGHLTSDIKSNADGPKPTSETSPAPQAGAYNADGLPQNLSDSTLPPAEGEVKPPAALQQAGIAYSEPQAWVKAAVNEVADAAGLEGEARQALAEAAETIVRAGEDMPEAAALAESMGLAAPTPQAKTSGRRTKIVFPAEAGAPPLPARYSLVELDSLEPSHTFRNYTPNPAWTPGELAQQRNYDSGAMEATRQGIELDRLNYDILLSPATDAVNGPPIVTPDGKILGGNNRSHRIYNRYDADGYRQHLLAYLQSEDNLSNISPEAVRNMKKPVLVRVVDGVDAADVPGLIGALNADFTTRRDPANLAANRGMRVGPKTMLAFAAINDQTVAAYLDSPDRARRVLQAMVEDGALQGTDLPGLYDFANDKWLGDGRASGKAQVEQALFGAVLPDSRLLDDMAAGMKKKLVRALPALIRLKRSNSPELDSLVQAVTWHGEFRDFRTSPEAKGLNQAAQLELFRKPTQKNIFTGEAAAEKSGPAWDMFRELLGMKTQREAAEYFTRKADDLAGYSRGLFGQAALAGNGVRGDVTFYDRTTLIRLFRGKADFSTITHEMGHVFLHELEQRAADGLASEASVRTLDTLRRLAGGEFTVDGVEKVIRHWEAYLREGKAPSRGLVDAFGTFRSWLTGVYEDVRGYLDGDSLTAEVREAFDHLLASDAEIREVREYYYATREYLESLPVYKPSERKAIEDLRARIQEEELSFQDRTRIRAWLRALESREPVYDRARAEIDAMPVYSALDAAIEAGGFSADEVIDLAGRAAADKIRALHGDAVFGGRESILDAVAGDHGFAGGAELIDALTQAAKKKDAVRERVRDIMAERREAAGRWLAEAEAVPGDAAYHGGERLQLMAMQLEGLRRILNETKQKRIESLNLKALTDAAAATVRGMLVRDIGQHRRYAMAERAAGRKSLQAAKDGDYQAAYDALQLQMYNHAITAEMFRKLESRERFKRGHTLKKMLSAINDMQDDFREPLRQLLTRYGVVKRPSGAVGPNGQRLQEWVTPKQVQPLTGMKELTLPDAMRRGNEFGAGGEMGENADHLQHFRLDLRDHVAPWIQRLEGPQNLQNWQDLTVGQMEDLRGAIGLVVTHGKGELTALLTDRYRTLDEAVQGIVEEIVKHGAERSAVHDPDTASGRRRNAAEAFLLKGVTLDSLFAVAEGNRSLTDKAALQKLVENMRDCEARETNWHADIMARLLPNFKQLGAEAARLDQEIRKNGGQVDGLPFHESLKKARGKSGFTGAMLIAANFNTGNADNLFQLQNAYDWDDGHIAVLRRQLTAEGWQAVEAVWREMDKLFPEMDKVRFWATHQHSPKEAGLPFATGTADGGTHESKGGYYPLGYDGLISRRQGAFQDVSSAKSMARANMTSASNKPPSGFAIARARGDDGKLVYKGPPVLSLSPILRHFNEVLHFITHGQAIWELDRITSDPRFEKAFVSRNGYEKYRQVRKNVNYLADFRQEQRGGPLMNWLHERHITSVLGVNFYSASKQRFGHFTALSPMSDAVITGENGTLTALKYISRAIWDFGISGNIGFMTQQFEGIKDMSRVMKARDEGGATQELRNAIANISPTGGDLRIAGMTIPVKAFRDSLFKLTQLFDRGTAGPLWTASYRMYMDGKVKDISGMNAAQKQKGAVAFADSIAMTQTSPFRVDHSALQRGENIIDKFSAVCISGVMQPGNMLYQKMAGAARGQVTPGQVASAIAKMYLTMSYTQILFSTLRGLAVGEEDPFPAWHEFILAPLDNMVNWIPYVRDAVSTAKYGTSGKGVPQIAAGLDAFVAQPVQAAQKAADGRYDAASWHAVKAFSFAAGIPITTAAKIYQDMHDVTWGPDTEKKKRRKNGSK